MLRSVLFIILGLLAGPLLIKCGIKDYKDSKALQANGKLITAQVTDGEERVTRKGRRSYWLTVSFLPEGYKEPLSQKRSVSSDVYKRAGDERTIKLTYLPSNPVVLRLSEKVSTEVGLFIGGCLVLLATFGYVVYLWRRRSPQTAGGISVNSGAPTSQDLPKAA